MVKIAAIADQHGNLGLHNPGADLLLLCGDHFPYYSTPTDWNPLAERHWCETKWAKWLTSTMQNITSQKGYFVPGNHDIVAYTDTEWFRGFLESFNIQLLDKPNTTHIYEGLTISGYPYTHGKLRWAYNKPLNGPDNEDEIPPNVDILMSHTPPLGFLDTTERGEHRGSPYLTRQMLVKSPRYILCGHIHEHRGRRIKYRDVYDVEHRIINVSTQGRDGDNKGGKFTTLDIAA